MDIERGLVRTAQGYIHYRATGRGPAIMLQHINQQSSALLVELMQVLGQRMRVVAIDYPGHGDSDHVALQPSIGDYACRVLDLMDALGIERAAVLGEAVGAVVSMECACTFPSRVHKVILVNCPFYVESADAERAHGPLKSGLRPADASGFPAARSIEFMLQQDPTHAPMKPTQSWMDRINVAQFEVGRDRWQALDALHACDIAGKLGRIPCPVLLLIGEHFHYLSFREEFAARIRDLRLEVIPGGRFCMTWERADEIGARVLEFLQ